MCVHACVFVYVFVCVCVYEVPLWAGSPDLERQGCSRWLTPDRIRFSSPGALGSVSMKNKANSRVELEGTGPGPFGEEGRVLGKREAGSGSVRTWDLLGQVLVLLL